MDTYKIIREKARRYVVYKGDTPLFLVEQKGGFWWDEFRLFNWDDKSLVAIYKEQNFLFKTRKKLFLEPDVEGVLITSSKGCYEIIINAKSYKLSYGFSKFNGFFIEDVNVGTIKILKVSSYSYEKEIIFSEAIQHAHIFILLYIGIDDFDVN
jgi:hypothetical protein